MSKETYTKLIEEDINWLNQQEDSVERKHIKYILIESIKFYYPEKSEEKNVPIQSPQHIQQIPQITYTEILRPKWRDSFNDSLDYDDRDY